MTADDEARLGTNRRLIGRPGSRSELDTPALLLDLDAVERNIERMVDHVRRHGLSLRPHAKTHKSVEIARRQIAAGAAGICCATLGEAEAMVAGGIPGVLITSPVVRAHKIERLVALNEKADGLMVVADHPDNVDALAGAAASSGRPLTVVVDIDVGSKRTGVPSAQQATALARQIRAASSLRFGGVQGYAGFLQHVHDDEERRAKVAAVAEWLGQVRAALNAEGLPPPIISGGGTGSHAIEPEFGAFTELQCGSYVVMDVDYDAVGVGTAFEDALFVQTSVVSAAHEGFVTTDAGLKAFATDGPKPVIARGAPPGATYTFAGDEHGRVHYQGDGPKLGDLIECVTPHCDPTVNLYDVYHVVRGDTLVDIWPVDARGKR